MFIYINNSFGELHDNLIYVYAIVKQSYQFWHLHFKFRFIHLIKKKETKASEHYSLDEYFWIFEAWLLKLHFVNYQVILIVYLNYNLNYKRSNTYAQQQLYQSSKQMRYCDMIFVWCYR